MFPRIPHIRIFMQMWRPRDRRASAAFHASAYYNFPYKHLKNFHENPQVCLPYIELYSKHTSLMLFPNKKRQKPILLIQEGT